MREILFRGKRVDNGEWIYGDYAAPFAFYPDIIFKRDDEFEGIAVIPETVGQFTGLTDKNGKRIFEGDILKSRYDDEYPDNVAIEVVKWIYNGWHTQQGNCTPDTIDDVEIMPYSEVVGNVHDNPELMEGE